MTRIVRRVVGAAVLLTVLSLTGPADGAEGKRVVSPASPASQAEGTVWQRVLSVIRPGIRETGEKKGAGIDPNGSLLGDILEVLEPVINPKKGAGIDPNG